MVCFESLGRLCFKWSPVFLDKVDHTPRLPYPPISYSGRENVTLSRRPPACVNVSKFLKTLDKKNWGVVFRLFIDRMIRNVAFRVDDIPLSQGVPGISSLIPRKAQRDLT
jgi:hypothetical protein